MACACARPSARAMRQSMRVVRAHAHTMRPLTPETCGMGCRRTSIFLKPSAMTCTNASESMIPACSTRRHTSARLGVRQTSQARELLHPRSEHAAVALSTGREPAARQGHMDRAHGMGSP